LYKRFILEEKLSLHLISLNPTSRKTPSSHPRNNSLKKRGKEKKPQPFILRNPFEEIKKLNNQPSLSLYFHLMTLSHPT